MTGTIGRCLLLATLLLGAGCSVPMQETTPRATLENTTWKLLELRGQPARVAPNESAPNLLLDPAKKQVRGNTGCNGYSGRYELTGDTLRFGPLLSTRRACADPEMNRQESAFLKALDETRAWQITGEALVLTGDAGAVARFAAQHGK